MADLARSCRSCGRPFSRRRVGWFPAEADPYCLSCDRRLFEAPPRRFPVWGWGVLAFLLTFVVARVVSHVSSLP